MNPIKLESHVKTALAALKKAKYNALDIIGSKAADYAADNVVHPKALAPEIRNSLTHVVQGDTVYVGSNLQVAPYIELGTGPNYQPPPEWLENNAKGGKGQAGLKKWFYYDPLEKQFKIGTPQVARPFLRPAITEHLDEYNRIIEAEMSDEE